MPLSRSASASFGALPALALFVVIGSTTSLYAQAPTHDVNSASASGATNFVPSSFDIGDTPGSFVDYAPPPVPTYNLSSPRRTDTAGREIQESDPATRKLRQEETLGRVQTKDGSVGLETDRRGDPSKLVPFNDFTEGQAKKPDSFIGFSIVKPYDPK